MAYAQVSYAQRLGTGNYTIAQVGCFITAFCNLLERYGEGIDPPTINQYFIDHNDYMYDPGEPANTKDAVGWSTVASYDGHIVTTSINTTANGSWPTSNDAIVKFIYKSPRTGATVTHFCLVADHTIGQIIDSWDGVAKISPYGNPVAWATYEHHIPQVVTPPAPAEQPAFTVEAIAEVTKQLKIDTHLWDLNQRSWPAMTNNPVGTGTAKTPFKTVAIAHHILGGAYYLPEGSTTQGYNIVDTEDVEIPQPPVEVPVVITAPTPPDPLQGVQFTELDPSMKKMYITKPGGAEKWNFKDVTTWGEFKSVRHYNYGDAVFISGSALHPLGARYEVDSNDWNGFTANGQPQNWYGYNKVDLGPNRPSDIPGDVVQPATPVEAPVAPVEPTPPVIAPIDWQSSYSALAVPLKLVAVREVLVSDLSGQKQAEKLPAYDFATIFKPLDKSQEKGVVKVYGTVFKDGIQYYRLRTNNDPDFKLWYCIPVADSRTHKPNLVPYPTPTEAAAIANPAFLASIVSKIDAILASWFNKNKKIVKE